MCFAIVPGNAKLNLKALAKLTGDRKVETVPLKEVQPLTGYIRGGVTVLGAKGIPRLRGRDDRAVRWYPSRPMRGLQILLAPNAYLQATRARSGPLPRLDD